MGRAGGWAATGGAGILRPREGSTKSVTWERQQPASPASSWILGALLGGIA